MMFSNVFIETLKSWEHDKVLLVENGKAITAGELLNSSISIANELLKNGVKKGDRTVIILHPGSQFLIIMYANMLLGTIISIIDPEMGRENYNAKFKQFKPQHAFVDSRLALINEHPVLRYLLQKLRPTLPFLPKAEGCKLFTLGRRLPIFKKHKHLKTHAFKTKLTPNFNGINPSEDFLVTYTSGTLNEPKGVVHTYESLGETMHLLTKMLNEGENDRIATHLPHFMLLGVNAGKVVFIWNNELSPNEKLKFIKANSITTIFGPPSDFIPMINQLKSQSLKFPDCINQFYFGSAPVYQSFLQKIDDVCNSVKLTCLYGMTENLMVCIQDGHEKINYKGIGDLVGRPFSGVTLSINLGGEVGIKSAQKFARYWHEKYNHEVHLSGDLGELDKEGRLLLIGRKKDMLIRRNFNIYPGLYEPTINKIPGIVEAVLIGVYDKKTADETVYLIVESDNKINENDLKTLLLSGMYSIDKEAIPDKIIFQKLLRLGRQNKIDRKKIRIELEKEFHK